MFDPVDPTRCSTVQKQLKHYVCTPQQYIYGSARMGMGGCGHNYVDLAAFTCLNMMPREHRQQTKARGRVGSTLRDPRCDPYLVGHNPT